MTKGFDSFTDAFIQDIGRSLSQGERVRRKLPDWGRIHIDRQLPFLCLYRRPPGKKDPGTARLILGEAAHLRAPGLPALQPGLSRLVSEIARTQGKAFGAFLLLELWAGEESEAHATPAFHIHAAGHETPAVILETLESALLTVRPDGRRPEVRLSYSDSPSPPHLAPLEDGRLTGDLKLVRLGLEVRPVYRDGESGALFPFELRALHHGLARALKRTFYEFSHACTSHRPAHFQELGRRAMTKAVWKTDRQLAQISSEFDLLLHVSPVNSGQAWEEFSRHRHQQEVEFLYRPRPVDPGLLKRRLFDIPVERIEVPTLTHIFDSKREELDRQITLVADRNTPRFLLGSRQLYGDIEPELMAIAEQLLAMDPDAGPADPDHILSAEELARLAGERIEAYRQQDPALSARVEIRDDVPGIMVSRGNFLIGRDAQVSASRLEATLAHEIDTHVLTYHNGRQQPFRELQTGMAGYEPMQEGLAVVGEYLAGGLRLPRLRLLAARVLAVGCITDGAGFLDTFRVLHEQHGLAARPAFTVTMRIFRGGGYTKDAVYLRGLIRVLHFLASGKDLLPLYMGKISAEHLPFIEELQWRQVLHPPSLTPRFLGNAGAQQRLQALQRGMSVVDLAGALG